MRKRWQLRCTATWGCSTSRRQLFWSLITRHIMYQLTNSTIPQPPRTHNVPNFSKLEQSAAELLRFEYGQFWCQWRTPSWIWPKVDLTIPPSPGTQPILHQRIKIQHNRALCGWANLQFYRIKWHSSMHTRLNYIVQLADLRWPVK